MTSGYSSRLLSPRYARLSAVKSDQRESKEVVTGEATWVANTVAKTSSGMIRRARGDVTAHVPRRCSCLQNLARALATSASPVVPRRLAAEALLDRPAGRPVGRAGTRQASALGHEVPSHAPRGGARVGNAMPWARAARRCQCRRPSYSRPARRRCAWTLHRTGTASIPDPRAAAVGEGPLRPVF